MYHVGKYDSLLCGSNPPPHIFAPLKGEVISFFFLESVVL